MIVLNERQELAKSKFLYWFHHPESRTRDWFEISGPAGSGKTTVVKSITSELGLVDGEEILYVAFIGKAALAMRLSGVPGRTIHSVIYHPIKVPAKDANGDPIIVNGIPKMTFKFVKNETLGDNVKLIVVDEGGMVESNIATDLLSYGVPLLVLGDLNQLPPVFGASIFLRAPDVILDTVMRQKEGSPILYIADLARFGYDIPYGSYGVNQEVKVIRKREFVNSHQYAQMNLRGQDMVICGTNYMRDSLNIYIRENIYGMYDDMVEYGDHLICRHNYWDMLLPDNEEIALTNGMIGKVTNVNRHPVNPLAKLEIDFKPDFATTSFVDLPVNRKYIFDEYTNRKKTFTLDDLEYVFELGYCITCHLAQGSQANNVLVFVENYENSEYFRRWLYTAVTRAKETLTIVI